MIDQLTHSSKLGGELLPEGGLSCTSPSAAGIHISVRIWEQLWWAFFLQETIEDEGQWNKLQPQPL